MAIEIPLQVNNFACWKDGWRFIGMTTHTLPNLANLTDTFKGSGYGGEGNYPVRAHYADWEVVFNFAAMTRQVAELMKQEGMMIETMPGIEYQDTTSHQVHVKGWRFTMMITPRGADLATLEVGAKQPVAISAHCTYIKGVFEGETIFEKDKVNMIDETLHFDYARESRVAIGII